MQPKPSLCNFQKTTPSSLHRFVNSAQRRLRWVGALKSWVTDDLGDDALLRHQEGPAALASVREGRINVLATLCLNGDAAVILNLAAESLVLGELANLNIDLAPELLRVERLLLTLEAGEAGDRSSGLSTLVDELNGCQFASLELLGSDLLEGGITHDAGNIGLGAEIPLAVTAIGEGDVDVLSSRADNLLIVVVEYGAAEVFVLDVLAEENVNGLERAFATRRLSLNATLFGTLELGNWARYAHSVPDKDN